MYLLVTKAEPQLEKFDHPNLGRLVQPRHYPKIELTSERRPWAADNDCYNGGVDEEAFTKMLDRMAGLPRCLFVTAPDVVADMDGTMELFPRWRDEIRGRGLPVALVLQNGHAPSNVPWDELDAVFVGGTTEWKMGTVAAAVVAEANRRKKWTHMGRVNTDKRIRYARSIGCKSVDGTGYARFMDRDLLKGLDMCSYMDNQTPLF